MRLMEGFAPEGSLTHPTRPPTTMVWDSSQDPLSPQSHLGPEGSLWCLCPHKEYGVEPQPRTFQSQLM